MYGVYTGEADVYLDKTMFFNDFCLKLYYAN